MHGITGYRKLDYYTVCCWQQLLLIRTRYADSVVTPYRSPGCADVLCGARADVTDFSYMTLMDKPAVKHNMLKIIGASLVKKHTSHLPCLTVC